MPSNYPEINWVKETAEGDIQSVGAGVTIKARVVGAGADVAESPLTTDADGKTVAGTFAAVAVGTHVRFRGEQFEGMAASVEIVTT